MLPNSIDARDDKHAKFRRWLCWRGSRWFVATMCRTTFLGFLPLIATIHKILGNNQTVDSPNIISQTVVRLWWIASVIAWILERCRVRLIRSKILTRIPFLSLLFMTYVTQIIVYFIAFSGELPSSVNTMQEPIESLGDVVAHRRMRGGSGRPVLSDFNSSLRDGKKEAGVVREVLGSWNEIMGRVIYDAKAMEKMSAREIVKEHEYHCDRGTISIILACHNEHEYSTRTLESLLNSTAPGLLREILIIDDGSHPPMNTSYDTVLYKEPLIKIIRSETREGLIRSKTLGGNIATGSVIVFLDAHVKPDPGWVFPILRNINTNYKRVVVPKIPILNGTTWEVNRKAVGEKMMFDWDMSFHWFNNDDDWVPCMSGGLLAMSKRWWHESGELDTGMFVWGAENIEQSVRIWLCGGEIVVAHDSVIAHVFRPKFPYSIDSTKVLYNKLRTVEVWFDEYKDLYYNTTGYTAKTLRPKVPIPYSGQGTFVDSDVDASGPFVNISQRVQLREKLKCKPFSWYVQKFEDVFRDRNMLAVDSFLIRNPATNRCLRPYDDLPSGEIGLSLCDEQDYRQRWTFRFNETSIQSIRYLSCLDATIGKMPFDWKYAHLNNKSIDKNVKPLRHYFETFPCQRNNVNQNGWKLENNRITFGSFCVETDDFDLSELALPGAPLPKVLLTSCTATDLSRNFNAKDPNIQSPLVSPMQTWDPPPNQYFQIFGRRILQPTEAQAARALTS